MWPFTHGNDLSLDAAAQLRTGLRRHGVQVGTVDVLLAQLCLGRDLTMLTTARDFNHMAAHTKLKVWS